MPTAVLGSKGRLAPTLFLLVLSFLSGCGSAPTPHASKLPEQIQWEPLARWSGKGDQQLDSFQSDSGALRIEWEAKAIAGAPTADTFKVVVHSSISGRPLAAAVIDHRGEGKAPPTSAKSRAYFS